MERTLAERGKKAELSVLAEAQPGAGATSFTRQQSPLGLGHAVWCARDIVGNEPFAVLLPDMLIKGAEKLPRADGRRATRDLGDGANIIAVEEVPEDQTHMYGIVGVGKPKGKSVRDHRDGREAAARNGAIEPDHHRPLHPAAGNLRHSGEPAEAARVAKSSSPTR